MEVIKYQNFAYTDEERSLFPLLATNVSDGSVNFEETRWLIEEAARTFSQKSIGIPTEEVANVLSQILGAAQSHGLVLRP